jgi:hypothetical protein
LCLLRCNKAGQFARLLLHLGPLAPDVQSGAFFRSASSRRSLWERFCASRRVDSDNEAAANRLIRIYCEAPRPRPNFCDHEIRCIRNAADYLMGSPGMCRAILRLGFAATPWRVLAADRWVELRVRHSSRETAKTMRLLKTNTMANATMSVCSSVQITTAFTPMIKGPSTSARRGSPNPFIMFCHVVMDSPL